MFPHIRSLGSIGGRGDIIFNNFMLLALKSHQSQRYMQCILNKRDRIFILSLKDCK